MAAEKPWLAGFVNASPLARFPLPLRERVHSECLWYSRFYVKNGQREALAYAEAKPSEGG
jgi:hypothetical protein